MKNRIGKISITVLLTVLILLLIGNVAIRTVPATPINSVDIQLGTFTGPEAGTDQDDNVKASLDLAHTDLDAIIATQANQNGTGTLIAGHTYVLTSSAAVVTSSAVQLYAVLGGPIEIVSMFGECTVDMAGSPGNVSLILDATIGDYDAAFTTAVNIDAADKGDIMQFAAISSGLSVLVPTAAVNAGLPVSWFAFVGDIEQLTASTGTGAIVWHMTFRPLTSGVTVTAY